MDDKPFRTYLFEYPYQGARWGFEIRAADARDAQARLRALSQAEYQGELMLRIPVCPGFLYRFFTRIASSIRSLRGAF